MLMRHRIKSWSAGWCNVRVACVGQCYGFSAATSLSPLQRLRELAASLSVQQMNAAWREMDLCGAYGGDIERRGDTLSGAKKHRPSRTNRKQRSLRRSLEKPQPSPSNQNGISASAVDTAVELPTKMYDDISASLLFSMLSGLRSQSVWRTAPM